ncbi:MAG: hypothetical protein ACFHVJ_15835 [Aestuariibacter sp.]
MKLSKIFFTTTLFISCAADAAFHCSGKVQSIALGPKGGVLQVDAGFGVHYLCRIHDRMNDVPPEVCRAWFSMLLAAQASGREISQSYNPGDSGAQNCEQLGSWKVPNPFPYYVALSE